MTPSPFSWALTPTLVVLGYVAGFGEEFKESAALSTRFRQDKVANWQPSKV
jgi:hypothetical protein